MALVASDITAPRFRRIGPRHAALIGCQEAAEPVSATASVAGVDRGAAAAKRHCLSRTAVVAQCPEFGIDAVRVSGAMKIARLVAAQVKAFRLRRSAAAVLWFVAGDLLFVDGPYTKSMRKA